MSANHDECALTFNLNRDSTQRRYLELVRIILQSSRVPYSLCFERVAQFSQVPLKKGHSSGEPRKATFGRSVSFHSVYLEYFQDAAVAVKFIRRILRCQQSSAMLLDVHTPINPENVFTNVATVAVGGVAVMAIRARGVRGVRRDS